MISAGADAVYFTAEPSGALYVRLNPTAAQSPLDGAGNCEDPALACTLEASATRRTPPDPLGSRPAAFMAATPNGKSVFFASPEKLTDEANTGPEQPKPQIQRAEKSGPPIKESLPITALGIAKDAGHLYWVNRVDNAIGRSDLNGENRNTSFISIPPLKVESPGGKIEEVPAKPQYVAVDDEHVYWSSEGEGKKEEGTIGRADIDGTPQSIKDSIEGEWIKGMIRPKGIALDAEYVYWAKDGLEGKITKARSGGRKRAKEEKSCRNSRRSKKGPKGRRGWRSTPTTSTGRLTTPTGISATVTGGHRRRHIEPGNPTSWARLPGWAGSRSTPNTSTGRARAKKRSGGCRSPTSPSQVLCDPANPPVIPSCEPNFIPTDGKPNGLAVDGADLRWSVNGEVALNLGNDLYRYRPEGEELEDLTPLPGGNGAEVKGVLGASGDGKRVYFVANGDLDGAGEAQAGDCKGFFFSFTGRCSLYLAQETAPDEWSTTFIAPLDASGDCK